MSLKSTVTKAALVASLAAGSTGCYAWGEAGTYGPYDRYHPEQNRCQNEAPAYPSQWPTVPGLIVVDARECNNTQVGSVNVGNGGYSGHGHPRNRGGYNSGGRSSGGNSGGTTVVVNNSNSQNQGQAQGQTTHRPAGRQYAPAKPTTPATNRQRVTTPIATRIDQPIPGGPLGQFGRLPGRN